MSKMEAKQRFVSAVFLISPTADQDYQWIGPDPTHISSDVVVTTTGGVVGTTTVPVDVEIQQANTVAADGSREDSVLLSPDVVAEITEAVKDCKELKRITALMCVERNKGLQRNVKNIIYNGLTLKWVKVVSDKALGDLSFELLSHWVSNVSHSFTELKLLTGKIFTGNVGDSPKYCQD